MYPNFFGLSLFCVFAFLGSSVSEGCNRDRVGSAWVDPGSALEDSRTAGVRIDSAQAADGVSRASDFAVRLEQFGYRNALFKAEELVVLSDGAPWIRTACEEILAGPDMTFILDLFHALEKAADAVQDLTADEGERTACLDWIRERLNAGQVAQVIAALEPHRHRSEAVAAFIRYCETNADRMRCDLYRARGLPVGSGVVESACKHIVGNRFKKAGCRWSKAGANALLAVRCCLENMRWPDFLEWRICRAAAA